MPKKIKEKIGFEELLDNLNLAVFRTIPKGKGQFVFTNSILCSMLQYSSREILEIRVSDVWVDPGKFQGLIKKVSRSGKASKEELSLKTRTGVTVLCSVSINAVKDEKGKILYIDGVAEDISAQKKIEKELNESRELFKTVFNNSAAAIMVTDKKENIIAWNPFAEEMLDMNEKDLFNKPVKELYPPKEWRRVRDFRLRQKGLASDIETQVYKKGGNIIHVNISVSVIKDSKGKVMGSIGIMHDITKQKIAERKIKESENKIRIILDNTAAVIVLTDEQDRIVTWNRYTEQLLGMNRKQLHLRPISSIYPSEEWEKIQKKRKKRGESRYHLETKIATQKGKVIDVGLSANALKDATNNFIGSVSIMQDITELKQTEQMLLKAKNVAEEANTAKSMFLANMSHEVRTPMNTIMGMVDLTLDTELTDEQRDNLMIVKNAADVLLTLLNDILDLSRVEAGKVHLENIEVSVENIVKSVCKGLFILARNKNVQLEWDVQKGVPPIVLGDPIRLRQILVNLANNAIKFTFKGKIRVFIKVNSIEGDTCELLFAVSDEGVGIEKNKLNTIFDVFTQADDSTTRRFGGTGLGLSISKKLVEMMGGRIWVESEEFRGSTFFFTSKFKIVKKKDISEALKEESIEDQLIANLPKRKIKQLHVLLAEDNIINQKIAARMLEKRGWTVKTAVNGKDVLDCLDSESFDLILMDALMPVLDGFEATKLIRENEKKTGEHIPIIALTARAMAGDRKKCLDSGMDGYVPKPIDRKKLFETIEQFF